MGEYLEANWNSRGTESMIDRADGNQKDVSSKNKPDRQSESRDEKKDQELKKEQDQEQLIREAGQMTLDENAKNYKIHLLSIIGEIEGHECLPANTKTTKYEHVLPQLAAIEDSQEIEGLLVIINTVGGDVESGLAIAEMIASLSKPSVSLVLGGSHSIGVPLAVATEYSFIVPTGTMIIHPVRMTGMVIGVPQTYDYFKKIQDRIVGFIASHCNTTEDRLEQLMMETGILTKDVGTILVCSQTVDEGILNEVGGIKEAMAKLYAMIEQRRGS